MSAPYVLILDFGSQYTQLIARRIREARVYCEIHPFSAAADIVRDHMPSAIVLSGGPAAIYGSHAPQLDPAVLRLGVPVLGICYGLQAIAHSLGGKVTAAPQREYGRATLSTVDDQSVPSSGYLCRVPCLDESWGQSRAPS